MQERPRKHEQPESIRKTSEDLRKRILKTLRKPNWSANKHWNAGKKKTQTELKLENWHSRYSSKNSVESLKNRISKLEAKVSDSLNQTTETGQ